MLLLFLLNSALVLSQSVTHITTSQGLSTNDLTATMKDRNNNMWIGSNNGVNKHEGSRIKIYNKIGKDSASISSAEMHCFFEDKLGFIWVGTTGGLDKINPSTDVITHYTLNSGNTISPSIGYIFSITQDKYDSIWVSTAAGFFKLDYKTGNSIKIKLAKMDGSILSKSSTGYKPGITTAKGIWFLTSPAGLVFYDYLKREFFHRWNNPMRKAIFEIGTTNEDFHVTDMCTDNDGNLYFVSRYNRLIKYNYNTEKLDSFRIPFPTGAWLCCNSIVLDSHSNIWIGYRHGGILIFNTGTYDFTPIINDDSHYLLSSNYVYSICKDYQGKMWVATNKGLDIIDYYNTSVISYTLSDKPDYTDLKYHAGTISYTNQTVHIPFYGSGIFNFDSKTDKFKFYEGNVKTKKYVNYIWADKKGIKLAAINNNISTIQFAENSFTVTNFASVLNKLLLKNKSTVIWREHVNEIEIYKCDDNKIFIVENNILLDTLNGDGIMKEACISADKTRLWYLTAQNELVNYNLFTKKADTILIGEACKKIDFALNLPRDLLDDGKNNIWITSQNGLLKYNLVQNKIVAFTTNNNLSHNFNYALALDRFGGIWAENLGGIDFYDSKKGSFKNAVTFLSTTYMNAYGSSIYGKDSLIYFLNGNQLYKINPVVFNSIKQIPPTLTLNELRVNGNTVLPDTTKKQLSFSYLQNRFEFKFSVLDFENQKLVKYFYYIEGLDKTWIDAGNKSEALYHAIQPGSYIFHVKATDAEGNGIKKELFIPFKIVPPFWRTELFYFFTFLAFCGLIFFFARWREKNIKAIEDGKLKLEKLNANQFKNKLELEQIVNYFSSSLINKNSVDDVL
ncbi:MAG: two-component regulator propeller domain-containing protein, partial [Ferruginibacter sp.]